MPEGGSKEREKKVLRIRRKENSKQRFTSVSDPYRIHFINLNTGTDPVPDPAFC